ncbi:alpha/beta hydrolase [Priestia megaterium]|uniref:Alpha/beta hydrolase n=1 Tax=Priestia megaterium TaxID=1404 RepID=A0A3D8X6Y1_PRIMG|nr:alpha/beta hydrolase [Priestia megaterium]MDH3170878.1 alpha/beta hydrolase [Priestia megaterium]RDZ17517.1 alpha/beta hydrolase [Priestia megaterium]
MGHYIEVEKNIKLFVEDIGEGQPVIFLHGWPLNHKMYEYQMNEIPQQGYRFIGIDFRGYGKSDKPLKGYDYKTMANDVRAVIDALDLQNAVLAGFSMGGPIAATYMIEHKEHQISKLMLLSAAAPSFTQQDGFSYGMKPSEVDELIEGIQKDRPAALAEFGSTFFGQSISKEFEMWFGNLGLEASSYGTLASAKALRDEDLRTKLSSITVPTLLLHGRKDEICPFEFAEQMQQEISQAELIPFEHSGHGLFYDEKEKFNKEILAFLDK